MQLRVVSDQPWDVAADVLAVPFVGKPALEGLLGELDRRSGGSLAALAAFGELKARALRHHARCRRRLGEIRAGLLLAVGRRRSGRRSPARSWSGSAPPSSGASPGRAVKTLAIWLGDLPSLRGRRRRGRGRAARPWRGRGLVRARHDLPRRLRERSARPRRADPGGARRGRGRAARRPPSAASSSARGRTSPGAWTTAPPTTSRRRSSRTRLGRSPRSTASPST